MRRRWRGLVVATVVVVGGACGVQFFERWAGEPAVQRGVPAATDTLWAHMEEHARELGLVVENVRPEQRIIQFGWTTAPGDGRMYLACDGNGAVGSASFRPRIELRPTSGGTEVIVSSETRVTRRAACRSTGRFEDWLLERFSPAITSAVAASDRPSSDAAFTGPGR